jgi:hypothetical protein
LGARFLIAFLVTLTATVLLLAGAGYAITRVAVPPPPELFRAIAFEFELAPGWWCELDETEYVCTPPGKPPRPAIAVMAMKQRNAQDNLAAYEAHLRQPRNLEDDKSKPARWSEIRSVGRRVIGHHEWVEGLHRGSEIANYDTYYLATATSYAGILVTLSVHRDYADTYIAQIQKMAGTLNVYQR